MAPTPANPLQMLRVPARPALPAEQGQGWDSETHLATGNLSPAFRAPLSKLSKWYPRESTPSRLEVGEAFFTPCPKGYDGDSLCGVALSKELSSSFSSLPSPGSSVVPALAGAPSVLGHVLGALSYVHLSMQSEGLSLPWLTFTGTSGRKVSS